MTDCEKSKISGYFWLFCPYFCRTFLKTFWITNTRWKDHSNEGIVQRWPRVFDVDYIFDIRPRSFLKAGGKGTRNLC
ncbi:hypothetical protein Awo_c11700 [Acetobacterium woodii DSM 1030]|uniref:Uncharacterized protein n=1 Tax=Acetobacterium woodii (strain ATCC 29683 / DSM 1030 / JCM 2381 / KCTC 1655 / WB1) TaxID=931626 RepID=H6LDI2_ACEWD|nr:hypothetical protein Awo_c11700 [Acetobacterium woodii DSM 1030]